MHHQSLWPIQILQFYLIYTKWIKWFRNPLGLSLMVFISKATRNSHVQHRFSHCKCNVASSTCKNNFLTKGCNRSSKKVFGFCTVMIKTAWKRQNSTGDFPAKISEISELLPWLRMSPYYQLFPSKYWCQTGFIKWITMTKGTWNYNTLISSYFVSHSVTNNNWINV